MLYASTTQLRGADGDTPRRLYAEQRADQVIRIDDPCHGGELAPAASSRSTSAPSWSGARGTPRGWRGGLLAPAAEGPLAATRRQVADTCTRVVGGLVDEIGISMVLWEPLTEEVTA